MGPEPLDPLSWTRLGALCDLQRPLPIVTMGSSSWLSLESSVFLRRGDTGAAAGLLPGSVTSPGLSPSAGRAQRAQSTAPHSSSSFRDTPALGKGGGGIVSAPRGQGHGKGGVTRGGPGCDSPHSICTKQLCSSSSAAGLITVPAAPGLLHKRCCHKAVGVLLPFHPAPCPFKSQLSQSIPGL